MPVDNIVQTTTINAAEISSVCVDQHAPSTSSSYIPNDRCNRSLLGKENEYLWLYDNYNEQTQEDEIWFDVSFKKYFFMDFIKVCKN